MAEEEHRGTKIALFGLLGVVILVIVLLASNILRHALNPASTTKVSVAVTGVRVVDPSHVEVTATVTSEADQAATVACLVGIERPAQPLAFPSRLPVDLEAGQTKEVRVERALIKPLAEEVTLSDVAFTCT